MTRDSRFDAPRSLARALAELARRSGGDRAREAELRAALPAAMGAWLHARLEDVRIQGHACSLVMSDETGAREARGLEAEILRELRRRMGSDAPGRLVVEVEEGHAPSGKPRKAPLPPAEARPLVADALREIRDERLRRRLAAWAGVSIDPDPSKPA